MTDWKLTIACVLAFAGWAAWMIEQFRARTLRANYDWNNMLLRKAWADLNDERNRSERLAQELHLLEESGIAAKRRQSQ